MRNILKLIALILLILAPITASIILGIYVSWWFLLLNLLYLIIFPAIYLYWQHLMIMFYFEEK